MPVNQEPKEIKVGKQIKNPKNKMNKKNKNSVHRLLSPTCLVSQPLLPGTPPADAAAPATAGDDSRRRRRRRLPPPLPIGVAAREEKEERQREYINDGFNRFMPAESWALTIARRPEEYI
uniref:Uncharacterized protein n=1 Tax=Oryza rufipogon TaxID=4529 RepID=A0A0E0R3I4_ORYRU